MSIINSISDAARNFFVLFSVTDVIDILIIAFVFYKLAQISRETRANPIIKAVLLFIAATWASEWLNLNTVNYILRNVMQFGMFALLVIFQPELRSALEKVGRTRFSNLFSHEEDGKSGDIAGEIAAACAYMSSLRIGALIVLERQTKIGDIIRTGCTINGEVSRDILINIFIPNTPLHDGAVVIRDGKILAARCILPLTKNEYLSSELGTRHRAAIGLTESSDAVVVVVSEETGKISISSDGDMSRNYTEETLKKAINKVFSANETEASDKVFARIGGKMSWKK